jgi:uncharacterized RDD family membrane protein YckC
MLSLSCPQCREPLWLAEAPATASIPCRYCGAAVPLPSSASSGSAPAAPAPVSNPYKDEVFWTDKESKPTQDDFANPYAPPLHLENPLYVPTPKLLARTADPLDRFFAAMIDGVLQLVAAILFALLGYGALSLSQSQVHGDAILPLAYLGAFALHIVQCVYIARRGQSLGKIAMGIRLANYRNDAIPDFGRSVVVRIWLTNLLAAFVPFFGLIDILMIFGSGSRCIHDMMAGTRVISLGGRSRGRK